MTPEIHKYFEIALKQGDFAGICREYESATYQLPEKLLSNVAYAYLKLERFDLAIKLFRQVHEAQKSCISGNNLGAALMASGDFVSARAFLETAYALAPSYKDVVRNLVKLEILTGNQKRLKQLCLDLFKSDFAEIEIYQLILLNLKSSFFDQKIIDIELELKFSKNQRYELINNAYEKLHFKRMLSHLRQLPSEEFKYNALGIILNKTEKFVCSRKFYGKSLSINPNYIPTKINMLKSWKHSTSPEKGLGLIKKYQMKENEHPELSNEIGLIYFLNGDIEQAKKVFKRSMMKFGNCRIIYNLAEIKGYKFTAGEMKRINAIKKNVSITNSDRSYLNFALSRHYERIGKVKECVQYLQKGNSLRNVQGINVYHHVQKLEGQILDGVKQLGQLTEFNPSKNFSTKPIFIVGMPRSGTSILEKILSSADNISGCGELPYLERYSSNWLGRGTQYTAKDLERLRSRYLDRLSSLAVSNSFAVDKMPQNFIFIPLILSAFPEAKILHISRLKNAVLWSNFRQNYTSEDGLWFTYNWENLCAYYRFYEKLMQFFHEKYPGQIIDIAYEKLVEDKDVYIRDLFKRLEIKFDEKALFPEKNTKVTKTASTQQVREPIFKLANKNWEPYVELLTQQLKQK